MTREEAIEYLNTLYMAIAVFPNQQVSLGNINKMGESVGMAIEALEQQPCEDAISRQATIDVVRKWFDKIQLNGDICLDGIVSLPSVTPHYTDAEIQKMQEMEQAEIQKAYELGRASQPKIGHWINAKVGKLFPSNNFKCSECDNLLDFDGVNCGRGNANYCPNCGAKMIEPPESEVDG